MNESRPIRVLHVRTVRGTGGGPDKSILASCEWLNAAGHCAEAFYILDRQNPPSAIPGQAQERGVRLHAALENGPFSLWTIRHLHRVLRCGRHHVVHTHDYKSTVLACLLRAGHSYQIVATAHGYNRTTRREWLYYAMERAALRSVDAVIAPTDGMCRLLHRLGVRAGRLHRIPNGIKTTGAIFPRRSRRNGCLHLLYLGRLSPEKDPANLLHATAEIVHRGGNVEVILAGDGPERKSLDELIAQHHLGNRVYLPGFVRHVTPLLASADVLVSPSRTECMPNAVLEAMQAGVPVVATDVGGLRGMIRDGIDGLLCRPNDPAALADAIERLAGDPALADRLADSARRRVAQEFSFEQRMEQIVALYRRLLAGATRRIG